MKCKKCNTGELDATVHPDHSDEESVEVRLTCDNKDCEFSSFTFLKRDDFVESE